jgi:hypothetical protein
MTVFKHGRTFLSDFWGIDLASNGNTQQLCLEDAKDIERQIRVDLASQNGKPSVEHNSIDRVIVPAPEGLDRLDRVCCEGGPLTRCKLYKQSLTYWQRQDEVPHLRRVRTGARRGSLVARFETRSRTPPGATSGTRCASEVGYSEIVDSRSEKCLRMSSSQ